MKCPIIFPTLKDTNWGLVNLNEYAKEFDKIEKNPLNDPEFCLKWVDNISKNLNVDYTFGGYLELRTTLWRGHYHNPKEMTHLGMDYNVPVYTPVTIPKKCKVEFTYKDMDQYGGWGGFIVFRLLNTVLDEYLIYGHLSHNSLPDTGKIFNPGDIVAKTGEMTENGGWYPHLHVQRFIKNKWDDSKTNFLKIDGYGYNLLPIPSNFPSFPNPCDFIPIVKNVDNEIVSWYAHENFINRGEPKQ